MAGLVPAIHAFFLLMPQGVDARNKRGHDEACVDLIAGVATTERDPRSAPHHLALRARCCGASGAHRQVLARHTSLTFFSGRLRTGRPVAAWIALSTAGAVTQIVGSPTPPQKS